MTKEDKKNAYLYCKFRDEQFALYDEYAKRNGMMMKTLLVVNALFYAKEGMTQKEICQRTFQSKQTVHLIIKNLLAEGYVTVTEVPDNKRNKIVQMTEEGRIYCEKVVRHITWAEDTAMSMFTRESRNSLLICPEPLRKILPAWSIRKRRKQQNDYQYSARTDTVQYYTPWLLKRFEEGYVLSRNPLFPNKVDPGYELTPKTVD